MPIQLFRFGEEAFPGVVEGDPAVGLFVPAGGEVGDVEEAVAFRAEQFGAGPIEEEAAGAADADGEREEAEADAAAGAAVGEGAEEDAHGAEDIEPEQGSFEP